MEDPIFEAWLRLAVAVVEGFEEDDPERARWMEFGREMINQRRRLYKSVQALPIGHMGKGDTETESIASRKASRKETRDFSGLERIERKTTCRLTVN